MAGPEKRLPGQSNHDYDGRRDPNAGFLGTNSLEGGGDPLWFVRLIDAVLPWRGRRRGQGTGQPGS